MSKHVTVEVVGPITSKQDSVLVGVQILGPGRHWVRAAVLEIPPEHQDALMVANHEANHWQPAWQPEEGQDPLF